MAAAILILTAELPGAAGPGRKYRIHDEPEPVTDGIEYVDDIAPSVVTASRKAKRRKRPSGMTRSEWRRHYRLVYNFSKVYPYALVGRDLMAQVDSVIRTDGLDKGARRRYLKKVEFELLDTFEGDIWHMTISQGLVLTRLIDRECGISPYEIIRDYSSKASADFWNLLGKLFSQDLKARYDPEGIDRETEELVKLWDSGGFEDLYISIFGVPPTEVKLPATRLNSI